MRWLAVNKVRTTGGHTSLIPLGQADTTLAAWQRISLHGAGGELFWMASDHMTKPEFHLKR